MYNWLNGQSLVMLDWFRHFLTKDDFTEDNCNYIRNVLTYYEFKPESINSLNIVVRYRYSMARNFSYWTWVSCV